MRNDANLTVGLREIFATCTDSNFGLERELDSNRRMLFSYYQSNVASINQIQSMKNNEMIKNSKYEVFSVTYLVHDEVSF